MPLKQSSSEVSFTNRFALRLRAARRTRVVPDKHPRHPARRPDDGDDDGVEARNRLVMTHVTLVKAMAYRLAQRLPSQVDVSDLVSVGLLGLIDAAGRYKASTGVPFDAFARRRIQGAMLDSLRELDWAPRSLRRLRRDVDEAIASARRRLGREPEEREVAEEMSLSLAAYRRITEQLRTLEIGAVRPLAYQTGSPVLETSVDPSEVVSAQLERKELRAHLARAIERLPARERRILALSYEEELTLAEIGQLVGVRESRVSQLRSLAISRLRTLLQESLGLTPRHGRPACSRPAGAPLGRRKPKSPRPCGWLHAG